MTRFAPAYQSSNLNVCGGAEAVRLPGKDTAIVFWAEDGTADAIYE
jgi:hypothetical protein